jgi:starch synthase
VQAHYRDHGKLTFARSVFVLHNIAHQGRAPLNELHKFEIPSQYEHLFYLDDPVGGEHMNIMKAGVTAAHRMVAVSHGYAWECQTQDGGWGLDATVSPPCPQPHGCAVPRSNSTGRAVLLLRVAAAP